MAEPYGGTVPGWALLNPPGAEDCAWRASAARILVTPATLMIGPGHLGHLKGD
jgi:hypothetical protein